MIESVDPREPVNTHLTDAGNAFRFIQLHQGKILYCPGIGWLIYDGKRWTKGENQIIRKAMDVSEVIFKEAWLHPPDSEERDKILAWGFQSEGIQRIKAMISLAQSKASVLISVSELDADPWLLNCNNGTVDLRTGELRAHDPKDLITKFTPFDYDFEARSELWEKVIAHAIPDDDMRNFLQKLVGYTFTGETGEDVFILIYGPTRTSKGTIQEAIANALGGTREGSYAITSELDILSQRDNPGSPRPELTRLQGARMVSIYESSHRQKLSASLVKTLAGSDPITCRTLYKEPIQFKPNAKIWLATNHLPNVPANDDALWERIRQLTFDVQLAEHERDSTIRKRLLEPEHAKAVLAWGVMGCLMWQYLGLKQPEIVRSAGKVYRASMDSMQRFIEEECILGPNAWTATKVLKARYKEWCSNEGEERVNEKEFFGKLANLGCSPKTINNRGGRGWAGIAIQGEHLKAVQPVTGDGR